MGGIVTRACLNSPDDGEETMDTTAQIEKFLRDIRRRNRREIILSIIFLPILGLVAANALAARWILDVLRVSADHSGSSV